MGAQIIHLRAWIGRYARAACKNFRDSSTTSPNRAKVNCKHCLARSSEAA